MKVGFVSLGCSKNLIDTEALIGEFKKNHYQIVNEAKNALYTRYNDSQATQRTDIINRELENAGEQGQTNIQTKVEESITNSKSTRQQYLNSLAGVVE